MAYCAILECKNDSRTINLTKRGISYHRFPKAPDTKNKWINATLHKCADPSFIKIKHKTHKKTASKHTKFQDVKALIKQECNIPDFILDNLVDDGYDSKKVRIGLTNENDGYRLMKCLEGFRMSGSHVLRIVPVSQPQSTFEQRSSYSNQPRNEYSNPTPSYASQNDYRPNTVNPASHGVRNMAEPRHNDRGMMDSRPSLTHVTNHPHDSRDHYESGPRRDQDTRSDFRDPNRGPLVPPTLRPASLNARVHGIDSRNMPSDGNIRGLERPSVRSQDGIKGPDVPGIRGQDGIRGPEASGMRGSDRHGMRAPDGLVRPDVGMRGNPSYMKPDHRQGSNSDVNSQPQWTVAGNNQWSDTGRLMQNQNTGYNYTQAQANVAYGQQPITAPQGGFPTRGPQPQTYQQQPKPAVAPERPLASSRSHVLRSVEIVDAPIQPRALTSYPQMQKPITIMKDNFQGPTQYNITGVAPSTPYQAQVAPQAWNQQASQSKQPYDKSYDDRHLDKALPKAQDYDKRRFSPPRGRPASPGRRSPPRNIQSTNRPQPYSDRRVSPSRPFRLSPNRHAQSRFSPTRRDMSPKLSPRRNSPRKVSPRRNSPGRRSPRRGSPRRISPFSRKISPQRRMSPSKESGRRVSPFGRKVSPSDTRRISPFGRKTSPTGQRRISPFGRKASPTGQRRISPFGRKTSPTGQRRISPFGRKASPPGQRRISPLGRKISPGRRVSPKRDELRRTSPSMMKYDYYVEGDRRMGVRDSPPRRYSPKRSPPRGAGRYSPNQINYGHDDKDGKGMQSRPAYDAKQAQKYTGAGFRPNEIQYPAPARNDPKISPWQSEKIVYPSKDEARANPLEEARKKLSPRRSRSRSPGKDRFRRHSPSPRSPRRSWALEKRRSPEILPPPPPLWPGQEEEKPKHPIWERNAPDRFDDKHRHEDKYRNDDKFSTRAPRFSPRRDTTQYTDKLGDYGEGQYRKSPRDEKKLFSDVDKDFDDIYQRAVEFRRKTEELRKSNEHRTRYDDEEQRRDRDKSPLQDKSKPTWITAKPQNKVAEKDRNQLRLDTTVKEKRDKASEEIALRILEPHNFTGEQRLRVMDELKFSVFNIMLDMFKEKDVSYIELVIKFRARYDAKDDEKILMDVLASMPSHYKNSLKRKGDGITEVPAKMSRPTPAYSNAVEPRAKLADSVIPDWTIPIDPPKVLNLPLPAPIVPVPPMVNPALNDLMMHHSVYVPMPHMFGLPPPMPMSSAMSAVIQSRMQPDFEANMKEIESRMQSRIQSKIYKPEPEVEPELAENVHNLYLCQDDFEPFSDNQADKLRAFLVSQMFKASEINNGWAPDFAFKGLNSSIRYEVSTADEDSKSWLINLDFRDFEFFNVLVYTKEELWYERAAIWLPGHSRYRNIEPLEKLRLQNKHIEGINIGKWKCVKKIVTMNGTRLYVDMPPSSARALEKKKMMLSYELGKVNVYLKAVAVDKEVFDSGLKAHSITDPSKLLSAVQNTVMPTISKHESGIVKVTLNGVKNLTIEQAGKIKEMIIYNLFKYHEQEGKSKTDFVKYGFCQPDSVGLVPENRETKRWLMGRDFGKLNKKAIMVGLDCEEGKLKYFRITLAYHHSHHSTANLPRFMESLKTSNTGVKGLNFQHWKVSRDNGDLIIDMDLESVETLIKLNFKLDMTSSKNTVYTLLLKSEYSLSKLQEKIRKWKAEQVDSYVVANMDLGSDSD